MSSLQNENLPLSSSLTDCFVPKKNEKLDNVISKLKGRIGIVDYKNLMENNSGNTLPKEIFEKEQTSDEILIERSTNTIDMSFLPKSVDEHSIFTKSYLMWENNSNICWLDASMSLLVHNHTLQRVLADTPQTQMGKIIKHHNDAMSTLNDYTSPDNSEIRLSTAKELLKTIQDSTLKYLQPFLKCIDGQPDSAFCSLFNLISKDKSIKHLFDIEYSWIRSCEKCHVHRTKKDKKVVITLPHVKAFHPNSPITVCQCPACKESDQNMVLVYKSLPQCLLFHFENGAGKGELQSLDFEVENRRYKITGIMTLEKGVDSDVNHFVTWIRDPDTEGWLECNDLNLDIISFSVISPCINLEDVYILMYEAWGEFSNVPLILKGSNSDVEEESAVLDIPLIDITEEVEERQIDIINQKGGSNEVKNSRFPLTTTVRTEKISECEEMNVSSKCQLGGSTLLLSKEALPPERINNRDLMLSSAKVSDADTTVDALASLLVQSRPPGESQFSKSSMGSCAVEKGLVSKKSRGKNKEPKLTSSVFDILKKSSACLTLKDSLNSQKTIRDSSESNKKDSLQVKSIKKYFGTKSVTLKKVQSNKVEKLQEASSETVKIPENYCCTKNSGISQNFAEMEAGSRVAKSESPINTSTSMRKKLKKVKVPLFIEKVRETKNKTVTLSLYEDSSNNIREHQVALKEETIPNKASVDETNSLKLSCDSEKTYFQDASNDGLSEILTKKVSADVYSANLKKTKVPQVGENHSYSVNVSTNNSLILVSEPLNSQKSESNQISVEHKNSNQTSDELMRLREITVKSNDPVGVELIGGDSLRVRNVHSKRKCKEYVTNKDSQTQSISASEKSKEVLVCMEKDKSSESLSNASDPPDGLFFPEYLPHLEELQRKKTLLGHTQLLQSRGIVVQRVLAENTFAKPNNIKCSSEVSSTSIQEFCSKDNSNIATLVKKTSLILESPIKRVSLDQFNSAASPIDGNEFDRSVVLPNEKHSPGTSMKKVCVLLQRLEDLEVLQIQANCAQNEAVPYFQKDVTVFKEDIADNMLKMEVKTERTISPNASLKEPNIKTKKLLMQVLPNPLQGLCEGTQIKIENDISAESPFCKVSKVNSPSFFGKNENARVLESKPGKSFKNSRKGGKITENSKLKRPAKSKNNQIILLDVNSSGTKFLTENYSSTQCVSKSNLNTSLVEDTNHIVKEHACALEINTSKDSCHSNLQKNEQDIPSDIENKQMMISNSIKRKITCFETDNCKVQLIEAKGCPAPKKLINVPLIAHNSNFISKSQEKSPVLVSNTVNDKNETCKRSRKPSQKLIEAQMHSAVFNADKRHSGEKSLVISDIFNIDTALKTYSKKRKNNKANAKTHTELDVPKGGKKKMFNEQDNLILKDATKPKQQQSNAAVDLPILFVDSAVLLGQQSSSELGRECKLGTFNLNTDYAKTPTDNVPERAWKCSKQCPCHKEDVYTQIDVIVDSVVSSMFDFFGIASRV